jgi:hypothetical protein
METIALTSVFLLSVWGNPVSVEAFDPPPTVETIEQRIDRVAIAHKIATTSLYNLVMGESSLGEKRVGDGGKSCGIIHFYQPSYPYEFENCEDDELILNKAAEMIANGHGYEFTPGNCYQFAKVLIGNLPKMAEILPNNPYPNVGGLAIFKYKTKHIGVILEVKEDGFWIKEANYEPYKITKRFIGWGDPRLQGYWRPPDIGWSPD